MKASDIKWRPWNEGHWEDMHWRDQALSLLDDSIPGMLLPRPDQWAMADRWLFRWLEAGDGKPTTIAIVTESTEKGDRFVRAEVTRG